MLRKLCYGLLILCLFCSCTSNESDVEEKEINNALSYSFNDGNVQVDYYLSDIYAEVFISALESDKGYYEATEMITTIDESLKDALSHFDEPLSSFTVEDARDLINEGKPIRVHLEYVDNALGEYSEEWDYETIDYYEEYTQATLELH